MSTLLATMIVMATALLSAAVAGFAFYKVAKIYFDNQQKMQLLRMKVDEHQEVVRVTTPIRLQAYERMALYLERISPDSLVLRCYKPGMDTRQLQGAMSNAIRDEWEHNLSQQVYLSSEVWQMIRKAKDEMTGVINSAAITIPTDADPMRLAGAVFAAGTSGQPAVTAALEQLKKEMRQLNGE